jgi:hypothetical protein
MSPVALFFQERTALALSPAVGWVDSVVANGDRTVSVSGWAVTADYPLAALGVRVRIDGQLESGTGYLTLPTYKLANKFKNLSGSPYAGYGNSHGFSILVPIEPGNRVVCVEAQNSGVYNTIGVCSSVSVPNPGSEFGRYLGATWSAAPNQFISYTWSIWPSSGQATYQAELTGATTAWDAALSLASFTQTANGSMANIRFQYRNSNFLPGSVFGVTDFVCSPGANMGTFPMRNCATQNTLITLNTDALNSASSTFRQKIIAHEFGHALGLGHPPASATPTVMASGTSANGTNGPVAFDQSSYNTLYGN